VAVAWFGAVNWVSIDPPKAGRGAGRCRWRYLQRAACRPADAAGAEPRRCGPSGGGPLASCSSRRNSFSITPGQAAVFYRRCRAAGRGLFSRTCQRGLSISSKGSLGETPPGQPPAGRSKLLMQARTTRPIENPRFSQAPQLPPNNRWDQQTCRSRRCLLPIPPVTARWVRG